MNWVCPWAPWARTCFKWHRDTPARQPATEQAPGPSESCFLNISNKDSEAPQLEISNGAFSFATAHAELIFVTMQCDSMEWPCVLGSSSALEGLSISWGAFHRLSALPLRSSLPKYLLPLQQSSSLFLTENKSLLWWADQTQYLICFPHGFS